MGQIESSNGPLRRIYRKLTDNHPAIFYNLNLRLSVKDLNHAAETKGLVPSILVLGTIPSMGNTNISLVEQEECFRTMYTERD